MSIDIDLIKATGEQDKQFVGLKIVNNHIQFHYPETYDFSSEIDKKTIRNDIISILRSISIAKSLSSDMSSYNSQNEDKENNVFPLGSYLWLINDYLTYGRYENKEKKFVEGIQGKINWKKTMKYNPVISKGNIIYTKIVSEKKDQKNNIITEIYNCCVKKSMDSIGWLYGLSFDSDGIDYLTLLEKHHRYYLSVINTELSHTFDENKKNRLQNMKNIITGLDNDLINTRELIYGVDSYDYVYERMIDNMFSNISDISEFYPNATVKLVLEPKKEYDSSNLRPDTIFIDKKKNNVFIIDAKNYRYGVTFDSRDIPETTSIQKQVTYGEYIKKMNLNKNYNEIYSAFIMPYSMTNNVHKDIFHDKIVYVGTSTTKWYDDDGSKNRKIANLLIDMKFLINYWNNTNKDEIIDELISKIENNIEKF